MNFYELLKNKYILLDGGFGTELIKKGLKPDEDSATAVFSHPDWVEEIHRSYVEAGANIIMSDTFSANRYKLEGSSHTVYEAIEQAITLAKKAAEGTDTLIGLDVSTLGKILEPAGTLSLAEAYDAFKEIAVCGEKAGADLICLETFTDLTEIRVAALAAKENTNLPVTASLTFDESGVTVNGSSAAAAAVTLSAVGVDALGLNCALGPDKLSKAVNELLLYSQVPVIVKPNAGLPDPETNAYSMSAADFAESMKSFYESGALLLGGCCGTTPEFIRKLKNALDSAKKGTPKRLCGSIISGSGEAIDISEPRIIGERINPTGKKRFKEALENNDIDYIVNQGLEQIDAGADILDVNVGHSGIDEKTMAVRVINALRGVSGIPLQIDSTNPAVIEAALRAYTGKAIINSVNGEEKSLNTILPIVKKYGAAVVGLTLDENGIPATVEERVKIAERIVNRAESYGIRREDIYIDCLTLTVSAEQGAAEKTLAALKAVKENLGVKTVLGVSNVSFGLPSRETVNTAFLTLALESGLDLPIMNPNSAAMTGALRAYKVLKCIDKNSVSYIEACVNTKETAPEKKTVTLTDAVIKGLKGEAAKLTEAALTASDSDTIINTVLIPALDEVGVRFESGKLFLPQLIMAADAAGACFDVIKAQMKKNNCQTESNGKIVIATVKGDVHDIGKNIVKTVLENYGYEMIDLGKDVPPEAVLKAQKESGAPLVGLSALMTTTLGAMEETIALLHKENAKCKIMVGGAVLTPEYAKKIGADFYAKDAKMSADIAKSVFGN